MGKEKAIHYPDETSGHPLCNHFGLTTVTVIAGAVTCKRCLSLMRHAGMIKEKVKAAKEVGTAWKGPKVPKDIEDEKWVPPLDDTPLVKNIPVACLFCGATENRSVFVTGPNGYVICDICIAKCAAVVLARVAHGQDFDAMSEEVRTLKSELQILQLKLDRIKEAAG
jgi:hypothetical protein